MRIGRTRKFTGVEGPQYKGEKEGREGRGEGRLSVLGDGVDVDETRRRRGRGETK